MAFITQTPTIVGASLSGILTYNTIGQSVFSIGWDYVFAAMHSDQLTGTLIKVNPLNGAPLSVEKTGHSIVSGLPTPNSWNSGTCMCSTTVDDKQYMYIRWDAWNNLNVYRGTWNNTTKQFENFVIFSTMASNIAGANYNAMARIDENTMKIITDSEIIYEFDIRTGNATRSPTAVGGTWSPSSYPFANAFVPIGSPSTILGASGDGANWYAQTGTTVPVSFNPGASNAWADGFNTVGTVHQIHPSTHHNVSYYTPNNGTITAYKNTGVYIQELSPKVIAFKPELVTSTSVDVSGTYVYPVSNLQVGLEAITLSKDMDSVVNENKTNTSIGKSGTIQSWIVPATGTYTITACGAQGGFAWLVSTSTVNEGGKGAKMSGNFFLTAGHTIKILVGQRGPNNPHASRGSGGGGGTFIYNETTATLLIAAGGGGGAGQYVDTTGQIHANITTNGNAGTVGAFGAGGVNGNGGAASNYSGGGAGWLTNGADGANGKGGKRFLEGGAGGIGYVDSDNDTQANGKNGGFGGGGGNYAGSGGGGGYSGGGGGYWSSAGNGGGAGSYNIGTNQSNFAAFNTGHGSVIIETALVVNIVKSLNLGVTPQGKFSGTLTGLSIGTDYVYRAYTVHKSSNVYSNYQSFKTLIGKGQIPLVPVESYVSAGSVLLKSSPGSMIVCNGETKRTGSVWKNLAQTTQYSAYAYTPLGPIYDRSDNSSSMNFSTITIAKLQEPEVPKVTRRTGSSAILQCNHPDSMIVCNGETKVSGSTWHNLQRKTQYKTYAYLPNSSYGTRSSNSPNSSFNLSNIIMGELSVDGDMSITGSINTRIPAVTNGLIAHFPLDGNGGAFDVIGGRQTTQNVERGLNLLDAMYMDWRDSNSWYKDDGTGSLAWDEENEALKFTGHFEGYLKTPIIIDNNKHYEVRITYMQESMSATNFLYLGGQGFTSTGAGFNGGSWDYSLLSAGRPTLGEWKTAKATRFGAGTYPGGWKGTAGLAIKYLFGGLFNYNCQNETDVVYIKDISIIITDEDTSGTAIEGDYITIDSATTNISLMSGQDGNSPWGGDGSPSISVVDTTMTYKNRKVVRYKAGTSGNAYLNGSTKLATNILSTMWTHSCYLKRVDETPITSISGYLYVTGTANVNATAQLDSCGDGWYRASYTRTGLANGYPTLTGFYGLVSQAEYYFADWQVEPTNYATTYTVNSRPKDSTVYIPIAMPKNATVVFDYLSQGPGINETIISNSNYNSKWWGVYRDAGRQIYMHEATNAVASYSNTYPAKNTWVNIALSWNDTAQYLYIDGVLKSTVATNGETNSSNIPVISLGFGWNRAFASYKNLSIYDRVLPVEEIKSIMSPTLQISLDGDLIVPKLISKEAKEGIKYDYHFPLDVDSREVSNKVTPSTESNIIYDNGECWVGEATTNIILNPTFTSKSNWSFSSSNGGTFTVDSNWAKITVPEGNIGNSHFLYQEITRTTAANTPVTYSAKFKNNTKGIVSLRLVMFSGATVVKEVIKLVELNGNGIPFKVYTTLSHTASTSKLRADILTGSAYSGHSNITLEVTNVQLQQKDYHTGFVNGTIGQGSLIIPFKLKPPYTINLFHRSPKPWVTIIDQPQSTMIFQLSSYYTNASISLWNYVKNLTTHIKGDSGSGWSGSSAFMPYTTDTWDDKEHMYTMIAMSPTVFKFYVDGELKAEVSSSIAVTNITDIRFENYVPNAYYKNLIWMDREMTDEEIKDMYYTEESAMVQHKDGTLEIAGSIKTNQLLR